MMKTELVPRRNSFKVVIEVSAGEKAALKRAMEAGILANHGFANGCMEIESCETNVGEFDRRALVNTKCLFPKPNSVWHILKKQIIT